MASLKKNRDIKKIHQIDTAEALSTPGIPNSAHQCMVTPRTSSIKGKCACSARELEEYEDVKGDTKLEDWDSVEVEMRNSKMAVKYIKVGWTPVARRKISRSEKKVVVII